ncbi:bifunctional helix-turn-helix transcriptional regulator/GNAT family N-acetyltransferase [Abyssalbus ytuae]|uniref:Bifunctional helix-turn-helix transcriptional regulator/GNAT family N-acetyltransferase n=1 Tax=Abyssalbus ytuae TaxID=2926907 RepID=A0A9E7A0D3_9FLAO|nr:bifunctional helix-turn-helix transcriptional regulator/GNAT family N-acetyltransferase [Abyssalbus ytuae]UOB17346.1 bifunctional helix-turn-helix transcriptional regulator/GNAT family N-acetyltransferase [Abyssalbus ytuae]
MDKLKEFQELGLGSRLKRLSEDLMKEINRVYKTFEIDFDPYLFPVFKTIADEKEITTVEITDKLKITQPAITQYINKLKEKNLIITRKDVTDQRKKIIGLSEKGKSIFEKMTPLWKITDITLKKYSSYLNMNFIEQIVVLESALEEHEISKNIISDYKKFLEKEVEIVNYRKEYNKHFKELNIEWLEKYFVVEPHDAKLLENSEETIINKGGHIFFSKIGQEIVGCFCFIKTENDIYELGKMAVTEKYQKRKIGNKMLEFSINFAKSKNWKKIILYSNTKLENAIHLYKKYGFKEVALEKNTPYLRSNIKMELNL